MMLCGSGLGDVFVWWMECASPSPALAARWRTCLSESELAKADRFHFEVDRSTYLAAHWLMRNALSAVAGISPQHWRFTDRAQGKPDVHADLCRPDLQFNLSHTRGFAACAISLGNEVGIDVEALARNPDIAVAECFFSPEEVGTLRAMPPARKLETFLRFWTLKEALIKATGEGLNRELDSFSFSLDPVSIRFHPADSGVPETWSFSEHRPTAGHLLALAVRLSRPGRLRLSIFPVTKEDGLTRNKLVPIKSTIIETASPAAAAASASDLRM